MRRFFNYLTRITLILAIMMALVLLSIPVPRASAINPMLFVAVGGNSTGSNVMTSSDGSGWLTRSSAANNAWNAVCWSAELDLFVAVSANGTGNRVMTSPDGITWTSQTSAANNNWQEVCWSADLDLFVAVSANGTGNRVMTSPDGITWTSRSSAADTDWRSVCWSPELDLFVAASFDGDQVMTSPNGLVWTSRTSVVNNAWRDICWSAELGLFVAVSYNGTGNRVMTSPNGITWTSQTSAANNGWMSVCWSAELDLFVAVSESGTGNRVMTSPDGITWTSRTSAANNGWQEVCWSADLDLFVSVSDSGTGNRVMTSPDGITWTSQTSAADYNWYGLCFGASSGGVKTKGALGIGSIYVTLQGKLASMGGESYVLVGFEYGLDTDYGAATDQQQLTATGLFYQYVATNILPNTTYHYRATASVGGNLIYGEDVSFTTMPIIGSSNSIRILSAKMFQSYMSPGNGDLLLVVEASNTYTGLYPNENPRTHFTIQLVGTDNTTILGVSPLANWGYYRPSSIYFNPAVVAANITEGSAYYVKMVGDYLSSNATTEYQLVSTGANNTDWLGYDLSNLDVWCRGVARDMGLVDGSSADYYIANPTDQYQQINEAGSGYFTIGIPNIGQIRPNLFVTAVHKSTIPAGSALNAWDKSDVDPAGWRSYVGASIASDVDGMASFFGVDGKTFMFGIILLFMAGCVLFVVGSGGFGALGALLLAVPILWLGLYFRVVPVAVIILIVLFFGGLALRQFVLKTT